MDISQAINKIAERAYENRKFWGQSLRQRRTEYTDVYGIPYRSEIQSNKSFTYHVMISPDMEYYERFQFKLYVETETEGASINSDLFKFEMTDTESYNEDTSDYIWTDLSPYLSIQQDEWPDGSGYFPSEEIGDADSFDFYDILDACGLLVAEGREAEKTRLLKPGNKLIRISSPTKCDVTLNLILKYSTINR